VWQALRSELHPLGLEVVTVALDTAGSEAARLWIEAARPAHPALIDQAHVLDEVLGIVNVPSGVWINEEGVLVRPPEPAFPHRPNYLKLDRSKQEEAARSQPPSPRRQALREAVSKIRIEPERYLAALRDWVANGAASRYVLEPDDVIRRSQPRPRAVAEAAASFELGQYLYRQGFPEDAVPWFRQAHRLQPDNWTYKRQAWSFADPGQGPTELYDGDWLSDVQAIGPENYYPPLQM
jgi:tetratricopeptide (TPR) repeat protein